MVDNQYTFTGGSGPEEPKPKDVDLDHDSPHHTLGRGPLQAAPGVHAHVVADVSDMPSSGLPHTHTEYSVTAHTHAAQTNADTVDNQHLNWRDDDNVSTYLWGVTNSGDTYLIKASKFRKDDSLKLTVNSPQGLVLHSPGVSVASIASFNYSGQYGIRFIADWQGDSGALAPLQIGSPIDGNSAARVDWVGANYNNSPIYYSGSAVVVTNIAGSVYFGTTGAGVPLVVNGDYNAHPRAPHILSWDSGGISVGNLNASAAVRLNWIRS